MENKELNELALSTVYEENKPAAVKTTRKKAVEKVAAEVPKAFPMPAVQMKPVEEFTPELSVEKRKEIKKEEARRALYREWQVESQKVTGVFRDLEIGAGGTLRMSARKYPWDQIENYEFYDGATYSIPLWLARHLNDECKYPVYKHRIDPNARSGDKVEKYVGHWNHRCAFISKDVSVLIKPTAAQVVGVEYEPKQISSMY